MLENLKQEESVFEDQYKTLLKFLETFIETHKNFNWDILMNPDAEIAAK